MLSIPHMIVVFVIVLVVFGPNKLPELARGLGKLMAEFRKASTDFKSAFEEEMREMERQARITELKKQAAAEVAAAEAATRTTDGAAASGDAGPVSQANHELQDRIEPVISPATEAVARSSDQGSEVSPHNPYVQVEHPVPSEPQDRDPVHDK
ncbi:MAG TPA: twin-arginine translocase TatA/TatE family subunit [Candidatus Dormibacteraeota bacterium]|nr:twin-arginine translocase TatA/TatE family subunit [Candidatus Dormibacteraeota bacterium]